MYSYRYRVDYVQCNLATMFESCKQVSHSLLGVQLTLPLTLIAGVSKLLLGFYLAQGCQLNENLKYLS